MFGCSQQRSTITTNGKKEVDAWFPIGDELPKLGQVITCWQRVGVGFCDAMEVLRF
jgi:hypothetical protein